MLNLIFVVAVFVDCFEILVCSPTSYMLWSLYVWHSEMVIHPLALSEIPQHQTAFHLIPEKHRSGASSILGVESFPESLSSRMDGVKPKTQQRHRGDERVTVLYVHE